MTPKQQEAWDAYQRLKSIRKVAKELGKTYNAIHQRIEGARKHLEADPGVTDAMSAAGLQDIQNLHSGWLKTDEASLYFQMPKDGADRKTLEEYAEGIKEALGDIPKSPIREELPISDADLLTRYLWADLHFGMLAWGQESGDDYDISVASKRLRDAMVRLLDAAPNSDTGLICNLGDIFHSNDSKNMTPESGHILDTDGRFAKIAMETTKIVVECIELAKRKHRKVKYVAVAGNHDRDQIHWLTIALMLRYEDDPAVSIIWCPAKMYAHQFGKNLLCFHHGDKAKPERLVMQAADTHAKLWGRTNWRYMDTGHIHHDSAKEIGGMMWESHRTLASKDAYAAGSGYVARQTMKAITVHREKGEIVRNTSGVL